jgi:hypothetical protein
VGLRPHGPPPAGFCSTRKDKGKEGVVIASFREIRSLCKAGISANRWGCARTALLRPGFAQPERTFERALEIDPRSSDARIGIARILVGKLTTGWTSSSFQQETVQQAVAGSERLLFEAIGDPESSPEA